MSDNKKKCGTVERNGRTFIVWLNIKNEVWLTEQDDRLFGEDNHGLTGKRFKMPQ